MRTKLHLLLLAAGLLAIPSYAGELNLFEWSAVAPIVVQGEILGEEGKYVALHVNHVLRGDVLPESRILIDRRKANRHRSRNASPKGLKLHAGTVYLVLLEPSENKKGETKARVFSLVRGVQGARPLPPEGA
ncbi:MAG: hypothetical protein GWN73_35305, partial [Actinobacteria bacterium]|nr:hypothetical protein [Actinomycetota bacterium]NIS35733.1 hypothetical protein [Actinomycetota bacterium]NIU70359.1 hypothetical protein [Actinomycetota bacterium]NIW32246.1 hypothetical protein [Actinomycetota bacterium]